jgi:hypothetical protein
LFLIENLYSQSNKYLGDLSFHNGCPNAIITFTIEAVSIPFEGYTASDNSTFNQNRGDSVQNDCFYRRFNANGILMGERNIYINQLELSPGQYTTIIHSSSQWPNNGAGMYGFAKYLVSIKNTLTGKNYYAYLNLLDSKYGDKVNGDRYGNDFLFAYLDDDIGVVFSGSPSFFQGDTIKSFSNGDKIKEYKVWEIIQHQSNPLETDFSARTTPFPVSQYIAENYRRIYTLGTNVVIDTVWKSLGGNDKKGYNTDNIFYNNTNNILPIPNEPGNIISTTGTYNIQFEYSYGIVVIADSGSSLRLKHDKKLIVNGSGAINTGDTLIFNPYSHLILDPNSSIHNNLNGVVIFNSNNVSWSNNSFVKVYNLSGLDFNGMVSDINNGSHIEIAGGGNLKICDNTTVTFDGTGTYLKLNSGAIVQLGQNAKIEFKNGAYIDADGVTFSGINGATWNSIVMENAGASTIKNCTFSNASVPIQIINTDGTGANSSKIISANRFNPSASHCVYAENVKNMLFENNNVYPSPYKVGLYIKNNTSFASNNEGAAPSSDNVIIKGNTFYDGHIPVILACYTSGYTSFLVQNNTFNGNNVLCDFIGREMGGDLKSNHSDFTPSVNKCFQLTQSNPNLYGNIMTSGLANIYNDASYPNMAPLIQNGQFIWIGGYNQLSCSQSSNIDFHTGIAKLDYGHNCFYRQDISKYHLVGSVNSENDQYFVRDNMFNSSPVPSYSLIDAITMNPVVAISGNPNIYILCNAASAPTTWLLQDKGFGIIDSIPVTVENTGEQIPPDVQLFGMAEQNTLQNNYTTAIDEFKTLINNYPASDNINNALYDLYRCYKGIDTSALQSHRNLIYGDLKTYLENKILSGLYSNEFTDIAYNITLMCLVNMTEYEESKTGYEFIALYHPDAYIRLMASWDYAEVDNLINGAGGESDNKELISDRKYMVQLEKKFEKMIPKNPVLNKVKEIYDSKRNEKYDKLNEQYKSAASKKEKEEINKAIISLKAEDEKSAAKVTLVLRRANKMEPEERSKRQFEDLVMTTENQTKSDKVINNSLPLSYQLSQNYPNPFNPVTKINFAIQKQGLVTLKVYDMLGREVAALVNEFKQAGYYSIDFNASGLSSGIYFYRLQANDFTDIKKMVLIK